MGQVDSGRSILIELCVEDEHGVRLARESGADRAELARDLSTGGLTPDIAVFRSALRVAPSGGIRVLVRENAHSFELTQEQVDTQTRDIERFVAALPKYSPEVGFVVGGLRNGNIDPEAASAWRRAAKHHYLVFHRAFDEVSDPLQALLQLIDLGYDAVLTTGGGSGFADVAGLSRLRQVADGRITVIGSGGIRSHNAQEVVVKGRLTDVHFRIPDSGSADSVSQVRALVKLIRQL